MQVHICRAETSISSMDCALSVWAWCCTVVAVGSVGRGRMNRTSPCFFVIHCKSVITVDLIILNDFIQNEI